MKKSDTIPLFSSNLKAFLGVFSVLLVVAALVLSGEDSYDSYVVRQIPLARDAMPPKQTSTNTFIIRNIDIGDAVGKDSPTLTEAHLKDLRSAVIQTNAGKTGFKQYLILYRPGEFAGGSLIFGRDNEGKIGSFVKFNENEPMFEYAMTFSPGLRSIVANGKLTDMIDATLPILGRNYAIVDAVINQNTNNIKLTLMGNAGTIDFEDHYDDLKFEQGVKINKQRVNADVRITAQLSSQQGSTVMTITEIRYQPKGQGHLGDVYVPPSNGVRTRLRFPNTLLSGSFDIIHGSKKTPVSYGDYVVFEGKGKEYKMTFTNDIGQQYSIPLVTTEPNFKYGDDDEDLLFKEGSNSADFNIDRNDLFIVTNREEINGVTNVLRYNKVNFDAGEIIFDDYAGGSKTVVFDKATGRGTLISSGYLYLFFVSLTGEHPIVVDQNGDGSIDGGEARIVLRTGSTVDLGDSNVIGGTQIGLSITTPSRLFEEKMGAETINFVIKEKSEGPDIEFPDPGPMTIKRDKHGIDRGLSIYGIYMTRNPDRIPSQVSFNFPGTSTIKPVQEGIVAFTLEREKHKK